MYQCVCKGVSVCVRVSVRVYACVSLRVYAILCIGFRVEVRLCHIWCITRSRSGLHLRCCSRSRALSRSRSCFCSLSCTPHTSVSSDSAARVAGFAGARRSRTKLNPKPALQGKGEEVQPPIAPGSCWSPEMSGSSEDFDNDHGLVDQFSWARLVCLVALVCIRVLVLVCIRGCLVALVLVS